VHFRPVQPHRVLVGLDDGVELHPAETRRPGPLDRVLHQGPADAASPVRGVDEVELKGK